MSKIKVLMEPHIDKLKGESGINRVVEAYFKYLPQYGIELVNSSDFDLYAVHAGVTGANCDVAHLHGIYWTADYEAKRWEYNSNMYVAAALRGAREVTVPSDWVAETIQRDMRFNPVVIPHGIEVEEWEHSEPNAGYVLWNKNRVGDVCDPEPLARLSAKFRDTQFITTFAPSVGRHNVKAIGMVSHQDMKRYVQMSGCYLATTKETFGIGILEAMAAGVPVLGFKHGAIVDLVEHGVNGYLAMPGDFEDLAEGLNYCLQHHKVLGENGHEMAKAWRWEAACKMVADVYKRALEPQAATVSVVIPCYNYADKIERAVNSVLSQTYEQLVEIIVVDDGSDDNGATEQAVSELRGVDNRVRYIRQDNGGVATARNRGIANASGKYICCLDADDALESRFLSVCVTSLEAEPWLGIAYTGLRYILPDGKTGISQWPGEFDYDKQLQRQNQIPTCCVFRREMWKRLGGYKQRYAPKGAGAEDAEFWLRAGAYGWKAKKVTDEPLFVYSWKSGRVSGDPDYKEVDWLAWHPWTRDGQHPFASLATPRGEHSSHPVRQYDEPLVSVIIPVGPGHSKQVESALDSLEAQTFRKWEVIIVDDDDENALDLLDAYPYIRYMESVKRGAGAARNQGASIARGSFILFLDADDWLYPDFLQKTIDFFYEQEHETAIYTDYVGKAMVSDPSKLAPDLQQRVYNWDGKEAIIGYRSAEYDCQKAQRQPEGERPYLWNNITTLFPRYWHDIVGGFDESMESWEDVDYWYRMARAGFCFARLPEELMVYRFYTGSRRDKGLSHHKELIDYMKDKYKGVNAMGCKTCGGKRSAQHVTSSAMATAQQEQPVESGTVYVEYMGSNRGNHPIIGHITKKRYAYAGHGWRGHIDIRDYEVQPHVFRVIQEVRPRPEPVRQMPVAPQPIEQPAQSSVKATRPPVKLSERKDPFDLQTIPGIGGALAAKLNENDIYTLDDLAKLGRDGLQGYRGVGKRKAEMIFDAIEEMA